MFPVPFGAIVGGPVAAGTVLQGVMTVGGIPSAAISIEAAVDEGAAIVSGAVAGVTTVAASLTTASGMTSVIGGLLAGAAATSAATVKGLWRAV